MNPEDTRQAFSSANPDVFLEFLSLELSQNEGFGTKLFSVMLEADT
jgi:hypothetical protein